MTTNNPVQALLDQLRNEFLTELPAKIEEIESLILGLTNNNNYEEIYRLVHSLKGAGGTHGIQIISVICHQLENHLEKQREQNKLSSTECIDYCLKYIDLLSKVHGQAKNNSNQFSVIEKLLNDIANSNCEHKYSALLIESSQLQINLVKQSLSSVPLMIETHNNGLKALEILLHKKYDIVLTGMEINGLNGEALISAMRLSKSINKNTKSILLTSKSFNRPKRMTDPDRIIARSKDLSQQLKSAVEELLKQVN
ncbi:MAG: Hpt domain-containing protein [Gammaproteobacteria bacterium]|nr:Hpt domain-containing protein [Gammaproteobacteria bacterium]MCW8910446.1 Hpt domain-containing protein [Gammaproteobacteria bacterium]MCW9004889.1 Hpt domain-containing protein [Gammaproteobacteria bacterium]